MHDESQTTVYTRGIKSVQQQSVESQMELVIEAGDTPEMTEITDDIQSLAVVGDRE